MWEVEVGCGILMGPMRAAPCDPLDWSEDLLSVLVKRSENFGSGKEVEMEDIRCMSK